MLHNQSQEMKMKAKQTDIYDEITEFLHPSKKGQENTTNTTNN